MGSISDSALCNYDINQVKYVSGITISLFLQNGVNAALLNLPWCETPNETASHKKGSNVPVSLQMGSIIYL